MGCLWSVIFEDGGKLCGLVAFSVASDADKFSSTTLRSSRALNVTETRHGPVSLTELNRLTRAPLPISPINKSSPDSVEISAVLDGVEPHISACEQDIAAMLEYLPENPDSWPHGNRAAKVIDVDYGRCHYILPDGTANHPFLVTRFCYNPKSMGVQLTPEQRWPFFCSLGFQAKASMECDTPNSIRAQVLTRCKFELLSRWLKDRLNIHTNSLEIQRIALRALVLSTQRYLRTVKHKALESFSRFAAQMQDATFPVFQSRIRIDQPGFRPVLLVTMLNYKPQDGAWQVIRPITSFPVRLRITFTVALDGKDTGTCKIAIENGGPVIPLRPEEAVSFFGVVDSTTGERVPYCDTTPTW